MFDGHVQRRLKGWVVDLIASSLALQEFLARTECLEQAAGGFLGSAPFLRGQGCIAVVTSEPPRLRLQDQDT